MDCYIFSLRRGWYSTTRVSKRLTDQSAACLRGWYCTGRAGQFSENNCRIEKLLGFG